MKKGLSSVVATLLIILLTIVAVGVIYVVIKNVIDGGNKGGNSVYNDCLNNFDDNYCKSINYTNASFNGLNSFFGCYSERNYAPIGQYINTKEEKTYCEQVSGVIKK